MNTDLAEEFEGASYLTLRLKASMYHRFHAPADCTLKGLTYISGDTWNVNPITLRRVERLFCRNERVLFPLRLTSECKASKGNTDLLMVPVAAILVAGIKLNFLEATLNLSYDGPTAICCDQKFRKGQEMGYFEHGSTILLLAKSGLDLMPHLRTNQRLRMGEPIFKQTSTT